MTLVEGQCLFVFLAQLDSANHTRRLHLEVVSRSFLGRAVDFFSTSGKPQFPFLWMCFSRGALSLAPEPRGISLEVGAPIVPDILVFLFGPYSYAAQVSFSELEAFAGSFFCLRSRLSGFPFLPPRRPSSPPQGWFSFPDALLLCGQRRIPPPVEATPPRNRKETVRASFPARMQWRPVLFTRLPLPRTILAPAVGRIKSVALFTNSSPLFPKP